MDVTQLLERAHTLADEGDWGAAAELMREHLQEFDDEPALHTWLGVAEREPDSELVGCLRVVGIEIPRRL